MQETSPVCALVEGATVYHHKQVNWDAEQMTAFIDEPHTGHIFTQDVPYPVNDITIFFEYWKREAVYDQILLNPLVKWVGTEYPNVYANFFQDYFGTHLGVKTTGRNIILMIYLPLIITTLYVLK